MSKVSAILNERLKQNESNPKMAALAKKSAEGSLTSFAGIFGQADLSQHEKEALQLLLEKYASDNQDISNDFRALALITSEVKAINNQAAILHGERIKRAQNIFKGYRDGAFTAWLMAAYGNRQTPYNFLQYYEFYESMPKKLHALIDSMPRQAVYSLASREGDLEQKEAVVRFAPGKTKQELLEYIRRAFPLENTDKRKQNVEEITIQSLSRVCYSLRQSKYRFTESQKKAALQLLGQIRELING